MERLTGVGNWSGKLELVTRVSGVTGVGNWSNWSGTMGGGLFGFLAPEALSILVQGIH